VVDLFLGGWKNHWSRSWCGRAAWLMAQEESGELNVADSTTQRS